MDASLVKGLNDNGNPKAESPSGNNEKFDFTSFFHGHTRASGWFSDRFGKPRRHFCGDFIGSFEDGSFLLDEKLFYTDGFTEERVWKVNISDAGIFTAESASLINGASGFARGNTLSMSYSIRVMVEQDKYWDLDMKDLMILQPDGRLHNIAQVYKWGIRIGSVSAQYTRHDGSQCCAPRLGTSRPGVLRLTSVV